MSQAKADVIIVNWNSGKLITRLLQSFSAIKDRHRVGQIVIVDNASTDDSLKLIEEQEWDLPVSIIKNKTNSGFASACNLGSQSCREKYLLFLNPDTYIYENSIIDSIEFLEKDSKEQYGACGIQLVDNMNIPNRSCARIPTFKNFFFSSLGLNMVLPIKFPGVLLKEWQHSETRDIGHVIGAFYFVRRAIFEEMKGFDERFFLYYEDLDFSTRLKQMGYKIAFLSEIRAVHIGGGSSQQIKAKRLSYSYLSKIKYIYKHFPFYKSLPLILIVLTLEPFMRFFFYLIRFAFQDAFISLQGYFEFLLSLPAKVLTGGGHGKA